MTDPPRPPLPPLGRPLGNPRRRTNEATPAPPLPPRTWTRTRSTNMARRAGAQASVDENVDEAPLVALCVPDGSRGEGVQGVVATSTDVLSRMDAGSALAHDHGTGVDYLAVEHLRAQSLRVRITPVLAGTTGFRLGHLFTPLRRRPREWTPPLLWPCLRSASCSCCEASWASGQWR